MSIAVVIPCFNNCATIGPIVAACRRHAPNVIVVSDGSTDRSAEAAASAGATVQVIAHQGTSGALRSGVDWARSRGCNTIVTIDADGAHDPNDIPAILETYAQSPSRLTIGDRFSRRSGDDCVPTAKIVANQFAARLAGLVSGTTLGDAACGLRAFHARTRLPSASTRGFSLLYEMLFDALAGAGISTCPVSVRYNANDLFITKRGELLDFLRACRMYATDQELLRTIAKLLSHVQSGQRLHVTLRLPGCPSALIIAHPVPGANGYIFQRQHTAFALLGAQSSIIL